MPARWPAFPPSRVVGNASSRAADGAGLQLQMAKRTGRSRCAVPSGSAGSSRAHSSTTSQRAPRSLTPAPTIRARIVQAESRERELGSDARLPHIEPYILFVIIFERLWLSKVHTPSNRALPKHRPCFASPLLQALRVACLLVLRQVGERGARLLQHRVVALVRRQPCRRAQPHELLPPLAPLEGNVGDECAPLLLHRRLVRVRRQRRALPLRPARHRHRLDERAFRHEVGEARRGRCLCV